MILRLEVQRKEDEIHHQIVIIILPLTGADGPNTIIAKNTCDVLTSSIAAGEREPLLHCQYWYDARKERHLSILKSVKKRDVY